MTPLFSKATNQVGDQDSFPPKAGYRAGFAIPGNGQSRPHGASAPCLGAVSSSLTGFKFGTVHRQTSIQIRYRSNFAVPVSQMSSVMQREPRWRHSGVKPEACQPAAAHTHPALGRRLDWDGCVRARWTVVPVPGVRSGTGAVPGQRYGSVAGERRAKMAPGVTGFGMTTRRFRSCRVHVPTIRGAGRGGTTWGERASSSRAGIAPPPQTRGRQAITTLTAPEPGQVGPWSGSGSGLPQQGRGCRAGFTIPSWGGQSRPVTEHRPPAWGQQVLQGDYWVQNPGTVHRQPSIQICCRWNYPVPVSKVDSVLMPGNHGPPGVKPEALFDQPPLHTHPALGRRIDQDVPGVRAPVDCRTGRSAQGRVCRSRSGIPCRFRYWGMMAEPRWPQREAGAPVDPLPPDPAHPGFSLRA